MSTERKNLTHLCLAAKAAEAEKGTPQDPSAPRWQLQPDGSVTRADGLRLTGLSAKVIQSRHQLTLAHPPVVRPAGNPPAAKLGAARPKLRLLSAKDVPAHSIRLFRLHS